MYLIIYCSYAHFRNKFSFIFDRKFTIIYSSIRSSRKSIHLVRWRSFLWNIIFSRAECKIIYKFLSISLSKSWKNSIFLHPVQHSSWSVDKSKIHTAYMWITYATLGVYLKLLTLLVFEISAVKSQKIGKMSKISSVWIKLNRMFCLNKIHSVDHLEI